MSEPRLSIPSEAIAVRRVRADAWRGRVLLVLLWVGGAAAMARLDGSAVCWGPILLLGGTAALIGRQHGAPVVGARARGSRGSLSIDADGVTVEMGARRLHFARAEIAGGWTETFRDREEVALETRGGTVIRVAVDGARQARAVLRAAGVAPDQRAVAIRLGVAETGGMRAVLVFLTMMLAPISATLIAVTVGILVNPRGEGIATALFTGVLAMFSSTVLWILLRPLVTTTLRIGTDGVVIQRLWRRRFVPRGALVSVGTREERVLLWRASGDPVNVRTSGRAEAAAVAQRIREATSGRLTGPADVASLSRLDRQGRSVAAWLRDVRALGGEHGGYREAVLDRRALLDVVEDGGAPAERRVAAAAALGGPGDAAAGEVRARVRAAAETCADPRLRAALEAAGAGELEEAQIEAAVQAAREA